MTKYWSDKRHRRRIDKKQAKPVDVFDMEGHYVATYPSARKAAIYLFPEKDYHSAERCIRACRDPKQIKRSFCGYQFRDHTDNPTDIEPYKRKPRKRGYTVNRKPDTYHTQPILVVCDDGETIRFNSVTEAAEALHGSKAGLWLAIKNNRKYKRIFKPEYAK